MIFDELTITTNTNGAEIISGVLLFADVSCFVIEDPNDLDMMITNNSVPFDYIEDELLEGDRSLVKVKVYLAKNEQGIIQRQKILAGLNDLKKQNDLELGELNFTEQEVNDKDWENNWKEFFHPFNIGEKFKIKPSWEECDSDGRIILEIDPESSFGTGQHETTSLCLELLEKTTIYKSKVLDMGCGSGILGIGAAKLGADSVLFTDIDQNAVEIAKKNVKINNINTKTNYICGDATKDEKIVDQIISQKYNIILANIVADIIIELTPLFKNILENQGQLICSGIIEPKKDIVIDCLKNNGFEIKEICIKNGWVAVLCQ